LGLDFPALLFEKLFFFLKKKEKKREKKYFQRIISYTVTKDGEEKIKKPKNM
jgi:hypothetical protein